MAEMSPVFKRNIFLALAVVFLSVGVGGIILFYGMGEYKTFSQPLKLHKESPESSLRRDEVSCKQDQKPIAFVVKPSVPSQNKKQVEKSQAEEKIQQLQQLLSEKEKALEEASKQSFKQDLIAAQTALKEANEKLAAALREKSSSQSSSFTTDTRLKNTTAELTNTLEELKKAREALSGIEGQYRLKLEQLNDNVKSKDSEIQRMQNRMKEKEGATSIFDKREKEYSEAIRKYQMQIVEFEKNVALLKNVISEKEKKLADASKGNFRQESMALVSLEREKAELEKQISDSSAKFLDQEEQLKNLEKKITELNDTLSQKGLDLDKKEKDLQAKSDEVEKLKKEMENIKSASSYSDESGSILSVSQKELVSKVNRLEKEKEVLENKLREAEGKDAGSGKGSFLDKNFRFLTETLVKKEEQIKQMEKELEILKSEKTSGENNASSRDKRLQELEVLVTALTRQLGEYSGLIEKKNSEIKTNAVRVAELAQELEAQKAAAGALQNELAEVKTRQENTYRSLTEIMSINTHNSDDLSPGQDKEEGQDANFSSNIDIAADNLPVDNAVTDNLSGRKDEEKDVKKRTEDLKRQVEVMLERKS